MYAEGRNSLLGLMVRRALETGTADATVVSVQACEDGWVDVGWSDGAVTRVRYPADLVPMTWLRCVAQRMREQLLGARPAPKEGVHVR